MPTRFTVRAACSIRILPTSVEPVKVIMRTSGFDVISVPTGTGSLRRHDVEHALGEARALGKLGQRQRRQRRVLGRLDDHRAARGERRRHLARDHGVGKIPRRDRRHDADRLLHDDDARVRLVRGDRLAVDALGLLGEQLDEAGAVDDLALGLGERLALLLGEQQRQLVGVLDDQLVPAAQDLGALLGEQPPTRA